MLGDKTSSGVPNQLYYNPQLQTGFLLVFGVPSDSLSTVYLSTQRMFEDMNASVDNFDFPQEWFQALKWGLCAELSEEYGVDEAKISRIEMKANSYLVECFDWSVEEASVYFSMARA
jgi:hypothetical protein